VCIYARDELSPVILSNTICTDTKSLYVQLTRSTNSIIFSVCYRPPNQSAGSRDLFCDELRRHFDLLGHYSNCPFVLLGDFNDACQVWKSNHSQRELGLLLVDFLKEYNFSQLIKTPTRGPNILDLLITNDCGFLSNYGAKE